VIPPQLARTVEDTWAGAGTEWLASLPRLLDEIARDWGLTLGPPYQLSYHWVSEATRANGSPAVLKLGVPSDGHLDNQVEALRIFDGHGSVRLLEHDLRRGALLLERAAPGEAATALVPHDDEQATAALIASGRRLHRPPPAGCTLSLVSDESTCFAGYLGRFPGDDGPLPRHLVERAGALFDELCASAPADVVLHGDLHHDNVLRAQREPWLAIDPHGCVGDPGYDCGAMLYNPDPSRREADLLALVPARLEQLADGYDLPVERVVAWGFVMGILSEVWTTEGSGVPGSRALDVATTLYPRLG
jgi:streptomycin 6-kinase